jgi:glycosyltransferase involved in cell wall biosynthesis
MSALRFPGHWLSIVLPQSYEDDVSSSTLDRKLDKPVTVLMPAYNAEKTVEAGIRSIVKQTYRHWDLLVIDDGSTDNTGAICRRLAEEDSRIVYYRSAHIGFSAVLNLGLNLIQGKYVARLDSDDISYSARLEKQIKFLRANPHVKVLATWGERINDRGQPLSKLDLGASTEQEFLAFQKRRKPLFLIHSSVMADRETLLAYGGFRKEEYPSDDIWLWTRIAKDHVVMAIPENLVGYRISAAGISNRTLWLMILQWSRLEYNLDHNVDLDMATFVAMIERDKLLKLRYWRGFLHKYAFRTGAYHFYNQRRMMGALYLAAGTLLHPVHVARRVLKGT